MNNGKYITGILLAAGFSKRMQSFKPMLKTETGETFIQSIINKLEIVCNKIIIVTGYRSNEFVNIIASEKCERRFNPNYRNGMFSSLQTGLSNTNSDWYLYHFVDQPSLPNEFYSQFVSQIDSKVNWIQPIFNNRKGHPILFDKKVKDSIGKVNNFVTLRDVSRDNSIKKKFFSYYSDLIFEDIDTPQEYNLML